MAEKNSKFQLNLLEEKQAFVVISLTDRLSLAGKLVASNALAHYNSERGYSWASIPVVAKESGYSPTSTKSISPGFDEIEKVGAFKVIRNPPSKGSKKSSTHRCCPIMSWFRDEYERLRRAGKIERNDDPFADIRSDNDNDERQDSEPGQKQGAQPGQDQRQGPQPDQTGSTTRSDRANNPVRQGYKPDEENREKRTDRNEQNISEEEPAASRRSAVSLGEDDGELLPMWASHPEGYLVQDWQWDEREFQPAIDLLGFDTKELGDEIDHFTKHHRGERRHDWNPGWLEWIQALKDKLPEDQSTGANDNRQPPEDTANGNQPPPDCKAAGSDYGADDGDYDPDIPF
jgi:hypothetical protein